MLQAVQPQGAVVEILEESQVMALASRSGLRPSGKMCIPDLQPSCTIGNVNFRMNHRDGGWELTIAYQRPSLPFLLDLHLAQGTSL